MATSTITTPVHAHDTATLPTTGSSSDKIELSHYPVPPVTDYHCYTGRTTATAPTSRLLTRGTTVLPGHAPLACDILLDEDVEITARDGVKLYADVYRPPATASTVDACTVPAIIAAGPFGKNGGPNKKNFNNWPWRFGCPKVATSGLEKFEGPDPGYWCAYGYAIVHTDCRGTWRSEGDASLPNKQEGEDNYDIVEFLAAQPWCNGKISFAGNSYLAITQWYAGAEQPPHLACLAPWEGSSDLYNDSTRGGVPDPSFWGGLIRTDVGTLTNSKAIDYEAMCYRYPTYNAFWAAHAAALDKIRCPLYIAASWNNPLHAAGTLRAWQKAGTSNDEKWLRVHNTHEWPDLYDGANNEDLRRFFDHYLKGVNNDWIYTPRVRLSVLDATPAAAAPGRDVVNRPEAAFPLARQREHRLYLDASTKTMSEKTRPSAASAVSQRAVDGSTTFATAPFDTRTEFTGYMRLRIWGEAQGADDMDVYATLQKFDSASGALCESVTVDVGRLAPDADKERRQLRERHAEDPANFGAYFDSGPLGSLRASHRRLDDAKSSTFVPVHKHDREEFLRPGEVVPLDISIGPYGMIVQPGQELRLTVTGKNPRPHQRATDNPQRLRNKGTHVLHVGGEYESYLLLPLIPSA